MDFNLYNFIAAAQTREGQEKIASLTVPMIEKYCKEDSILDRLTRLPTTFMKRDLQLIPRPDGTPDYGYYEMLEDKTTAYEVSFDTNVRSDAYHPSLASAGFFKLSTQKTVISEDDQFRYSGVNIQEIVKSNGVADIGLVKDGVFFRAIKSIINDSDYPGSRIVLSGELDTPKFLPEHITLFKKQCTKLKQYPKVMIMNHETFLDADTWPASEYFIDKASNHTIEGYNIYRVKGINIITTMKNEIINPGELYGFSTTRENDDNLQRVIRHQELEGRGFRWKIKEGRNDNEIQMWAEQTLTLLLRNVRSFHYMLLNGATEKTQEELVDVTPKDFEVTIPGRKNSVI